MEDFVPTRCAKVKKNVQENFVSVQFIAHKKKVVPANNANEEDDSPLKKNFQERRRKEDEPEIDPRRQQELEMKRARWDVIKFGMSGLRNDEANKAKVATAIALGARPPKKQTMNYKKLKEEREKAKKAAKRKERVSGADNSLVKKKVRKTRKNNKDSGILGVYGKVAKGGKS